MVPTPGWTSGAFTASSRVIQSRSPAVSSGPAMWGGTLSIAVTRPARGPARRRRSLSATGGNQTVGSEMGHQGGRNRDRAVWLLTRLQQSGEGAGQRHARRIQRVDELRLVARLEAAADVGAARLV